MSLSITTKSTTYPVTLAEVKSHLGYDGTDHDTRFNNLIAEATGRLERETDRTLTVTTYEQVLPGFRRRIWLPAPPLKELTKVEYYPSDDDSELVELTSDNYPFYWVSSTMGQGFMEIRNWPSTKCRPDAVKITYEAGWTTVPLVVKQVLLQVIGYLNSDREAQQQNFAAYQRAIDAIRHEGYPC